MTRFGEVEGIPGVYVVWDSAKIKGVRRGEAVWYLPWSLEPA